MTLTFKWDHYVKVVHINLDEHTHAFESTDWMQTRPA
jgi:hypothetical protein